MTSKPTVVTMSVAAVLAACSPTTYLTRVTRKHKLSGNWRDRSFAVVPESGNGGFDFVALADTVAHHLQRHGLNPAGPAAPEILVTLRYGAHSLVMRPPQATPLYARWAEVVLHEAHQPRSILFHGRAVSEGASRNLVEVLPHVIAGLLRDFPGTGKETLMLSLPAMPQAIELGAQAN